ncbi:MAG TPA: CocE/NonD family hydrolase [Actinomycetota bacterium]|nr:CocE/NonD family hydrolase [Actinomycetota bacterium]
MPAPTAIRGLVSGLCLLLASAAVVPVATAQQAPPGTAEKGSNPPAPTDYVRMSDGTLIAVNVQVPTTYRKGRRYPTIFEISGYEGGSAGDRTLVGEAGFGDRYTTVARGSRILTRIFNRHYVTVHANVRGTGCSGGEFDLFSWQSALDGREVIEWIARQPWSNGRVGIYGHSYGGLTGFMVAATRPPQLVAASVSGLIEDLYRGQAYPGGVPNTGFPVLWTLGIRPFYDLAGGSGQALVTRQDPVCARNTATHTRTIADDPVLQGLAGPTDNEWWRARSLSTHAARIDVPIHIAGAWQDEETGPRFPRLFELVEGVAKRMVASNGDHGTQWIAPQVWRDRRRWMDHWMRGEENGFGTLEERHSSVVTLLEMNDPVPPPPGPAATHPTQVPRANGRIESRTFPLEATRWTDWYLRAGGRLRRAPPRADEGSDVYLSGSRRQSWNFQAGPGFGPPLTTADGPDELTYTTRRFRRSKALVGPITATLFMSSTSPDTDVFVQLIDVGPDGSRTFLQRGLLKASHRALDRERSDWVQTTDGRVMYRPFHPHTNPTAVVPGEVFRMAIEVWPVGHVFRPGHRLMVNVHAPPTLDSYYAYAPRYLPGANTVFHDAERPSRIMLPLVPIRGLRLGPPVPCGQLTAVRCVPG